MRDTGIIFNSKTKKHTLRGKCNDMHSSLEKLINFGDTYV